MLVKSWPTGKTLSNICYLCTVRQYSALSTTSFISPIPASSFQRRPLTPPVSSTPKLIYRQCQRYHWKETMASYVSLDSAPVKLAHDIVVSVHDFTGLPWWGSIAITTILLRSTMTLPLSVYTANISARLERIQKEQKSLGAELAKEVALAKHQYGWTEKEAKAQFSVNMRRIQKKLIIRDNCHPFKMTIVAWVQIPLWISLSLAFRNMTGTVPFIGTESTVLYPDLASGGALWFTNFLVPDTTWALPLLLGLSTLAITELSFLSAQDPPRLQRMLTYFFRGLSVLLVPIAATLPSAMSYYWVCSSLYGLAQNLLLKLPRVRQAVGIAPSARDSDQPFTDMLENAKVRYIKRSAKDNKPQGS